MTHKILLAGLFLFCLFSCKSESAWVEFEDPVFITYLHDSDKKHAKDILMHSPQATFRILHRGKYYEYKP